MIRVKTSLGAGLLIGLTYLSIILFAIYTSITGIIMCFQASVLIGVASLLVQGSGALEALVYWFSGYDIAANLARALGIS